MQFPRHALILERTITKTNPRQCNNNNRSTLVKVLRMHRKGIKYANTLPKEVATQQYSNKGETQTALRSGTQDAAMKVVNKSVLVLLLGWWGNWTPWGRSSARIGGLFFRALATSVSAPAVHTQMRKLAGGRGGQTLASIPRHAADGGALISTRLVVRTRRRSGALGIRSGCMEIKQLHINFRPIGYAEGCCLFAEGDVVGRPYSAGVVPKCFENE